MEVTAFGEREREMEIQESLQFVRVNSVTEKMASGERS